MHAVGLAGRSMRPLFLMGPWTRELQTTHWNFCKSRPWVGRQLNCSLPILLTLVSKYFHIHVCAIGSSSARPPEEEGHLHPWDNLANFFLCISSVKVWTLCNFSRHPPSPSSSSSSADTFSLLVLNKNRSVVSNLLCNDFTVFCQTKTIQS